MLNVLPADKTAKTAFEQQRKAEHSDKEVLQLFDMQVLQPLDAQVQREIHRAAVDTCVAVALSPFVLADLLLVLWRSSRMLRQIALHYGAPIGQLRSLVLIKRLFVALAWAGGTEMALDLSADLLSSELTAKLSARAGQGVVAGLLVARLGLAAQQLMRPVPQATPQKLRLSELAKALIQRLTSFAKTKV